RVAFAEIGGRQQPTSGENAIVGKVMKPERAGETDRSVFGASVTAISSDTGRRYSATNDRSGAYRIHNLPEGNYRVEFFTVNIEPIVITEVPVQRDHTSIAHVELKQGRCLMTQMAINLMNITDGHDVSSSKLFNPPAQPARPLFTPRVRRYFPETLL